MSNIYIQEPHTSGKVVLKTSVGEIEIELWSRECPKACRNFVQLCMEGYYDSTIFHRVVKDFIVQGGDPTGTGLGGESVYGHPFKDEFSSRLRFTRRGLLGMANADKDDNGSQFFFTLGPTPELNRKHTLFGKVVGNTIFNMLKLGESEVVDERPTRPERILAAEIISNPFPDIVPRQLKAQPKVEQEDKGAKARGVKNYGLLSFGDEAEEEEEELETVSKEFRVKAKSAHDVGDPTLASTKLETEKAESSSSSSESEESAKEEKPAEVNLDSIKSKLSKKSESSKAAEAKPVKDEKEEERRKNREEFKKIQKELAEREKKKNDEQKEQEEKEKVQKEQSEVVHQYKEEVDKYQHLKHKKTKNSKEDKTIEMLNAFKERLFKAKKLTMGDDTEEAAPKAEDEPQQPAPDSVDSILTHRLELDEEIRRKVIDANIQDHDRYDIYDPRNPLNKRKREESKEILRDKKRTHSGAQSPPRRSRDDGERRHHHHSSSRR